MSEAFRALLRRAQAALSRRIETERAGGASEIDPRIRRLRMLEDLIKEQVPHEDSGHSTRPAR